VAFPLGINFRGTLGFVTDPTNYVADLHNGTAFGTDYPRTVNGNTFGWETVTPEINGTDRSNAVDARLAGINYVNNTHSAVFRIDLPASGTYNIQGAFGDATSAQSTSTIQLQDGSTVFATPVNNQSVGAGQFYAANGTLETSAANWATNNPATGSGADEISRAFTSTIFRTTIAGTGGSAVVASLYIKSAAGGGGTQSKTLTASYTANAALVKRIGKKLTASFTASAALIKRVKKKFTASFTANASTTNRKVKLKTVTASFTANGSLAKLPKKKLVASFTASAKIVRRIGKKVSASFTANVVVIRRIGKKLTASTTKAATLTKARIKTLTASFTVHGSMAKLRAKRLTASFTASALLTTSIIKVVSHWTKQASATATWAAQAGASAVWNKVASASSVWTKIFP
jgi:hypothetical protein